MKLVIIGTGYVGLVSGVCFAEFGHDVICVDKDEDKISKLEQGIIPIFEPGLDKMVADNVTAGRLCFSTNLKKILADTNLVLIAVGTPARRGDGHADLKYVFDAVEELSQLITDYTVIVTKSTVPVGTGSKIKEQLLKTLDRSLFDVASNPEFLREGSAIEDFMRPNRVVIGTDSDRASSILKELYRPLSLNNTPLLTTTLETAEVIKYAANAFLATKITFINEMADLCEKVGADVQEVSKGMGMDNRIGPKFLHAGPGYGGSCFPKDTKALLQTAEEYGTSLQIISAAVKANSDRKEHMAKKIITACGGDVSDKVIAILGLTFKPNTDDMRDSPALDIIPALQKAGAKIQAFDPEGMLEAAKLLPDIQYCDGPYVAAEGADCLVILTEWNLFRALDLNRVKSSMKTPLLVDLRNIYGHSSPEGAGFSYIGIGKPTK